MDTMQAAILIQKLKIFKEELETRVNIAQKYREKLTGLVKLQKIPDNHTSAWAQFSLVSKERSRIIANLETRKIPHAIYYPKPLHLQKAFSMLEYKKGDLPIAESISDSILSIPMHPYLSDDHIEFITDAVKEVLG